MDNECLGNCATYNYLGVMIDECLTFKSIVIMCAEDLHKKIFNCQSYIGARLWTGLLTDIECIPIKK